MKYQSYIVGLSVLDATVDGITGICLYSYNNHGFNESKIANSLETISRLLEGTEYVSSAKHIQSNVWSAPWLEEGYRAAFHGVTYMYDMTVCEIRMTPEKYMIYENPLDEFYRYAKGAMMTHYRIDDTNIIQPSENIKSLMLDLNKSLHYMQSDSTEQKPIWVPL